APIDAGYDWILVGSCGRAQPDPAVTVEIEIIRVDKGHPGVGRDHRDIRVCAVRRTWSNGHRDPVLAARPPECVALDGLSKSNEALVVGEPILDRLVLGGIDAAQPLLLERDVREPARGAGVQFETAWVAGVGRVPDRGVESDDAQKWIL